MPSCKYCQIIRKTAPGYKAQKAAWDIGSDFPRCTWHWQFVCDRCGRRVTFHGTAWCEKTKEFHCIHCAPRHKKQAPSFWAWKYHYEIWCQRCHRFHPALDWLEFKGKHPWQRDVSARQALRGLTREKKLKSWGWIEWAPEERQRPSQREVQKAWDRAAETWDATYDKYGDITRRELFNPALFPLIGDVKGKDILDAGCGAGYLCRLLAEKGAKVVGVDLSKRFIEIAKRYEQRKPLGIRYECVDLADLSRFTSSSFDLVVSMYVLSDVRDCVRAVREIARVLKPKGRFLFLIGHPCFDWNAGAWERVPMDSQRSEDNLYFKVDHYFRRGTLETQWGKLPVLLSFHRPLSDYFRYLRKAGFLVRDLLEPRPLRMALRERPREWDREDRIPPALIIEAVKPARRKP